MTKRNLCAVLHRRHVSCFMAKVVAPDGTGEFFPRPASGKSGRDEHRLTHAKWGKNARVVGIGATHGSHRPNSRFGGLCCAPTSRETNSSPSAWDSCPF